MAFSAPAARATVVLTVFSFLTFLKTLLESLTLTDALPLASILNFPLPSLSFFGPVNVAVPDSPGRPANLNV